MKPCNCGSGKPRRDLTDARGIFCAFVCDSCLGEKRSRFRDEIFSDNDYPTDEPIDAE